jgi:uncharacterized oligopeptide transporter (OPT) family protein
MATLSQGIVGGEMAWPLVIVGMVMGIATIMIRVKSPMLFSVGMYLPLETTFAIFVGGLARWVVDGIVRRRHFTEGQVARTENTGILTAAGLIAGEGLMGLVVAAFVFFRKKEFWSVMEKPSSITWALAVAGVFMAIILIYMISTPIRKAGSPDEPPPPAISM